MTYAVALPERGSFEAWRAAARCAIGHGIAPERIDWAGNTGLFAAPPLPDYNGPPPRVPAGFPALARSVSWHAAPQRFALLYQALWRLHRGDGNPLSHADPLGRRLQLMAKAVGRDIHKMHAFLRFRELPAPGPRRSFAAWFEPEHDTLEPASPFFARRFADMDWLIVTPRLSARFRDGALVFGPGGDRPDLPEDAAEPLWATYFANIFNPARIKLAAMRSEMPRKYWKNLPETRLIPQMLAGAEARVQRMHAAGAAAPRPGAAPVLARYRAAMPQAPDCPQTLDEARAAALQCRRCGLCEAATQTVWGEGPADAPLMIVGEQPGDHEDLAGRPFVGPAGRLLRQVMAEAGLDPGRAWLTNAVKHFKFAPRGKRRLHRNPDATEIRHCRWWLGLELALVRPRVTLALGASAALALTGDDSPLAGRRGRVETGLHGGPVLPSWHPAYVLRLPDPDQAAQARAQLAADLAAALRLAALEQTRPADVAPAARAQTPAPPHL
ncbi:DNA polymerase [Paracoccus aminovorans]|uniref:Type-4 uracil-DNA glycosylase n=1 Tax=Paracoccus aminovorans TaxID=34004 RepID=A0A1I3CWD4_9RHOB|nr:UdgX family uracil-DNA binding protein [Paracoccus aminovorans]CQR83928.1 uracil-DNA glycosylase [Paracoccus aminovorans]SFH78810.1 DNA polymerase [Paracoccus aminovorans]